MVTDRDTINFPRKKASAEKMEADRNALLDAVRMIYEKGREAAVKVYGQNYFVIAETPVFMKELGISGQEFSISYGVVSRHYDKDGDHNLPIWVWEKLPKALQTPFAIVARYRIKTNKETGEDTVSKSVSDRNIWRLCLIQENLPYKVHLYERQNHPDYFVAPTSYAWCFCGSSFSDRCSIPYSCQGLPSDEQFRHCDGGGGYF